jgi:predicted nucleic acid-binding protein
MAGRAIAFDNSVVSALVKSAVNPADLGEADKERAKRAHSLLSKIRQANEKQKQESKTTTHIPLPAITECLAGWEPGKHVDVQVELRAIGTPCYFDEKASIYAARAFREMIDKGRKPAKGERHVVKFDLMIAATALSADCSVLYHADGNYSSMSDLEVFKGKLAFEGLPAVSKEMFKDAPPPEKKHERDQEKEADAQPEEPHQPPEGELP